MTDLGTILSQYCNQLTPLLGWVASQPSKQPSRQASEWLCAKAN